MGHNRARGGMRGAPGPRGGRAGGLGAAGARMRLAGGGGGGGGGGGAAVPWPAALEGFPGGAGGGREVLSAVRALLPALDSECYKGQAGKVGVLGGCAEYSGAPYYAAMSALRTGCDLSHVFCAEGAAPVIKTYSPELIVHPYLHESLGEEGRGPDAAAAGARRVEDWLSRLTCLVVGPGLGRDPSMLATAREVLVLARAAGLPVVVDADGLLLVQKEPELVRGYAKAVLTPNANEFRRLRGSMLEASGEGAPLPSAAPATGASPADSEDPDWKAKAAELEKQLAASSSPEALQRVQVAELAAALGGVTVLLKGRVDVVSDGETTLEVGFQGCPRRCGGQGDVLAGAAATFASWALHADLWKANTGFCDLPPGVLAAYGAAFTTRFASHFAFQQHGRAMVGSDLLEHVGPCVARYFDGPAAAPKRFGFTKE